MISTLKKIIKSKNIDGYIIPKNDMFFSEYSNPDRLEFLTKFTGSAGISIVTVNKNFLFIDGRYKVQAQNECGKNFKIFQIPFETPKSVLSKFKNKLSLGYDPNLFTNGIDENNWKRLNDSIHKPLLDRVVSGIYPPGSTLKPFVALAALKNNVRRPPFSIIDKGFFKMPNSSKIFKDWKKGGHGEVDLVKAIAVSCDTFFYGLGIELGIPKLNEVLKSFGFGEKTNIDIPNEKKGLIANAKWKKKKFNKKWYQGETAITAIGQGYTQTTPIQLALATAKLISVKEIRPHLFKENTTPHLMLSNSKYEEDNNIDLNLVKKGMSLVTQEGGTASFIGRTSNYSMSAKTGTAQVFGLKKDEVYDESILPDRLKDHALFIAFAPSENPKLVVSIVVENGGHGGSTAGPIAKKVFDAYINKGN